MNIAKVAPIAIACLFFAVAGAAHAQGGGAGAGAGPANQSSGGVSNTKKDTIKSSRIGNNRGMSSRRRRRH